MVCCTRSTQPLVCGRPARMRLGRAPRAATVCWKVAERNSWALSVMIRSRRQPPLSQVGGDGAGELAGPLGWGGAAGHMQAGPGIGRGDVDGGVLPDRALGSTEAADAEAVQLDQLTGMIDLQVPL